MAFEKSPLEGVRGGVVSILRDFKCVLKRIAVRMMSLKPIFAVKNTPLTPLKGGDKDVLNLFKYALRKEPGPQHEAQHAAGYS